MQRAIDRILEALQPYGVKPMPAGGWTARCPAHDDKQPSLKVDYNEAERRVLICCHAKCYYEHILDAIGLSSTDLFDDEVKPRVVKVYQYRDEQGNVLHETLRFFPKTFRQRHPDGNGGYVNNLNGCRRVLYHLPELIAAPANRMVYLCEGEKDADNLAKLGKLATTNPMGGKHWRPEFTEMLRGRLVTILPDHDQTGYEHAEAVARQLHDVAVQVKVLALPRVKDDKDVSDWIARGGTAEQLAKLAEECPIWTPEWKGQWGQEEQSTSHKRKKDEETSSSRPLPRLYSLRELIALDIAPVRWAVPGLFPEGSILLAGKGKIGKSIMMLSVAIAIGFGGKALGKITVERGAVLYLALEDPLRRLRKRALGMLQGTSVSADVRVDIVPLQEGWPTLDNGGLEMIEEWLDANPDARLVVIDTLKKVRPRSNPKAQLYDVDYEAVQPITDLANRKNVCIVIVYHTRKASAEDVLDEISGSTGLTAAVDGALVFHRGRGKAQAAVHVIHKDVEDAEYAMTWDEQLEGWHILVDDAGSLLPAEQAREKTAKEVIVECLAKHDEVLGPKEISDRTQLDYNKVRQYLPELVAAGRLVTIGRGAYQTPGSNGRSNATPSNAGKSSNRSKGSNEHKIKQSRGSNEVASEGGRGSRDQGIATDATDATSIGHPPRSNPKEAEF